jgi:hypothetical protein
VNQEGGRGGERRGGERARRGREADGVPAQEAIGDALAGRCLGRVGTTVGAFAAARRSLSEIFGACREVRDQLQAACDRRA